MSEPNFALPDDRCGCSLPRRRVCDECEAIGRKYLACSLSCLDRHREVAHGGAVEDSLVRACGYARDHNRQSANRWQADDGHRLRLMTLISQLPQRGELCIFGAGDASDLELEQLTRNFREIHLVDLDGEALTRARDGQGSIAREKIVLHDGVDCSGLLEHLDAWGDQFPERTELARVAVEAAQSIVHRLGLGFPAVVSNCLLSHLALPFQRAWLTSRGNWQELLGAISAIHLATLAGSTRSGGRCLLTFDAASSRDTPALAEQQGRSADELAEFVSEACESGGLALRPDPRSLLAQLSSPGMRSLVVEPRVTEPWLWQHGAETDLVYGLTFGHP